MKKTPRNRVLSLLSMSDPIEVTDPIGVKKSRAMPRTVARRYVQIPVTEETARIVLKKNDFCDSSRSESFPR